jgi:7-carboxy-7-deazaguanine synthase
MALPVNEIFTSIQGEATYTGTPATFIRLQGCGVGCAWCDTKHTWPSLAKDKIPIKDMLVKECDSSEWAELSEDEILFEVFSREAAHIVITGGEPCDHDLHRLTEMLSRAGFIVQVETSGTKPISVHHKTFVTLSPKWDMAGGLEVLKENFEIADEIKMPVGKESDVTKLIEQVGAASLRSSSVWLQPLSQSKKATEVCVESATKHGFRISLQTHKYIGVR